MGDTCEIYSVLFVTRLLFMLPFSHIEHSRPSLRSPLWLRLFTLSFHAILLFAYIFYAVETLQNFKQASNLHLIKKASTFATLFIMQCVDIMTSVCAMIISQKTCKLVEKIMRDLVTIKRNIECNSSKGKFLLISAYTLILYLFKVSIIFVFNKTDQFAVTLAPVIASAMILASESLLFTLCVQLQKYFYSINLNLQNSSNLGHFQVAKLAHAFEMLSIAQNEINNIFGSFILFNLSQIICFLLYVPLLFIFSCITENDGKSCDSATTWIITGILYVTFCMRLFMIIWGCNIVTNEADVTAVKASQLIHREMDENTALELHSLLELSMSRRLTFSACGLFNIDVPLIFSVSGMITSYMFLITQLK